MQCEKIFEKIDELCEKYFLDMAKARGWKTEVFSQEKAGDVVCMTLNPDSENAPITFSGHTDTVHPLGLFGNPAAKRLAAIASCI